METEKLVIIAPEKQEEDQLPFVNEECGDTMWDDVLEEQDKKIPVKDPAKVTGNMPAI